MITRFNFDIIVDVDDLSESITDLGVALAEWLRESWFNGEDVCEVVFKGYEQIIPQENCELYKQGILSCLRNHHCNGDGEHCEHREFFR